MMLGLIATITILFSISNAMLSQIVQTKNSILLKEDTIIVKKPNWIASISNGSKHLFTEDSFKSKLYKEGKLYNKKDGEAILNKIIDTLGIYCIDSFGNEVWRKKIVPQRSTNFLSLKLIHSTNDLFSIEISSQEEDIFYCDGIQLNNDPKKKNLVFFDANGISLPYKFEVKNLDNTNPLIWVSNMNDKYNFTFLLEKRGDIEINEKPMKGQNGLYLVLVKLDKVKKEFQIKKIKRLNENYNSESSVKPRSDFSFHYRLIQSREKLLVILYKYKNTELSKNISEERFASNQHLSTIVLYDDNLDRQFSFDVKSHILKTEFDNYGNLYLLHNFTDTNFSNIKFVFSAINKNGKIFIDDTIEHGIEYTLVQNLFPTSPTMKTFEEGCFVIFPTFFGNDNQQRILRIKQYFSYGKKQRYFESKVINVSKNEFSIPFDPIRATKNELQGITTFSKGTLIDFEKGYTVDTSIKAGYAFTTFTIDDSKYVERRGFTSLSNQNFSFHTKELWDFTKIKDSLVLIPELIYIRPYDTTSYTISILKENGSVLFETSKPQKGLRVINYDAFSKGKYTIVVTSVDEKLKNTYEFEVK